MTRPFGTIVLSLSGGGTRAAGFHLGTLAYLDRVGLLSDVAVISTVSGGSFVGTTYALALKQGKTFAQYLEWVTRALREAEMVEWVLTQLATGTPRSLSGRRSTVVALAEVYDRHFFHGAKFGTFWQEEPTSHLEEVIFNATDFKSGLAFRFQRHGRIGNARMSISAEQARHLRLADVMAASSCIPGGLEPFFFPQDFVWEGAEGQRVFEEIRQRFEAKGVDSVPLMDGGVYDNQGVESVLLAVERMAKRRSAGTGREHHEDRLAEGAEFRPFEFGAWFHRLLHERAGEAEGAAWAPGLFIVSDTPLSADPVYRSGYVAGDQRPLRSVPPPPTGGLTLGWLSALSWVLVAVCGLTVVALLVHAVDAVAEHGLGNVWRDLDDVFAYVVPLVLAAGAGLAILWLRRRVRGVLGAVDHVLRIEGTQAALSGPRPTAWHALKRLTLRQVGALLGLRTTSMASLVSDIFMIRIRSLGYALLYGTPRYRDRIVANEIHDLQVRKHAARLPATFEPSAELVRISAAAGRMPTVFWFEHPGDLDTLVACGQATICYNLLEHIWRAKERDPATYTPAVAAIFDRASADWERLKADPYALVPGRAGART